MIWGALGSSGSFLGVQENKTIFILTPRQYLTFTLLFAHKHRRGFSGRYKTCDDTITNGMFDFTLLCFKTPEY